MVFYPVTVKDPKGKVKKVISSETLSNKFWEEVNLNDKPIKTKQPGKALTCFFEECRKSFNSNYKAAKFCSAECSKAYRNRNKTKKRDFGTGKCKEPSCENTFKRLRNNHIFCSFACKYEYDKRAAMERNKAKKVVRYSHCNNKSCGKKYEQYRSNQLYCTKKCRVASNSEKASGYVLKTEYEKLKEEFEASKSEAQTANAS